MNERAAGAGWAGETIGTGEGVEAERKVYQRSKMGSNHSTWSPRCISSTRIYVELVFISLNNLICDHRAQESTRCR